MQAYSFASTVVTIGNTLTGSVVPLDGFAEGDDVIQCSRLEDGYSQITGADGAMLRIKNPSKAGQIVLRLQHGSPGNLVMDRLYETQDLGAITCKVRSLLGGETIGGSAGFIVRPADSTRGRNPGSRDWTVILEDYDVTEVPLPGLPSSVPSVV